MNVELTQKEETSQAELKISVPATDFQPHIKKAAEKLSKEHPLKGFRPGKAPVKEVAEHVGTERLLREAMEPALAQFFVQAAVDHDIEAINRPNITIEELTLEGPLKFTAIVDVLPNVTLGDPTKLTAEKKTVSVDEDRVEAELKHIAKNRSKGIDVARPAEKGDLVTIDFAIRIGGEIIEGGESKNHPIELGAEKFVPDFEKNIYGISAGDTRTFPMKFPEDYPQEELRGRTAEATVTAHSIQKQVAPEINDEFAQGLGEFKDLADLKAKLKENMQAELDHKEQERYLGELAEHMAESSTFGHIPEVLIEREIDNRLTELQQMLAMQYKTLDDYLQQGKKTLEEVRENMRETAEKHIKTGLMLRRLAETHDISIEDQEVEDEAAKQLAQFGNLDQVQQQQIDPQELRDHITARLRNRKALEKLEELAKQKK